VPQIYDGDTLSGYVFVEDLGTLDLQTAVSRAGTSQKVIRLYQDVIKELIQFSQQGACEFEPAWCYQSDRYSKSLILEKECRYFVDAFLNTYLGLDYQFTDFKAEFELLADNALQHAVIGLMHRDFQSRNIMIRDNSPVLIDFQGARMGPLQYDLASLLIDPYVDLAPDIKSRLLQYCLEQLAGHRVVEATEFRRCYRYCCLARNLQILGAFGYLTRVKSKPHFEPYIPAAVRTLSDSLKQKEHENLPLLGAIMDSIESRMTGIDKRKD
jgi:aminoglycoside/choline kinase family phosphotransferase